MTRVLVVNADDFGLSAGVNRGVALAHDEGVLTSASLMVRATAAVEAAQFARRRPSLAIGLHADLGEWEFESGRWRTAYEVVPAGDAAAVEAELVAQLERFRSLLDRQPTHLDSHQHVHRQEPARSAFLRLAASLNIPLRGESSVRFCGAFYGQTGTGDPIAGSLTVEHLVSLIRGLPDGATELACHPAASEDVTSSYRRERVRELATLIDPRMRQAIWDEGVLLSGHGSMLLRARQRAGT